MPQNNHAGLNRASPELQVGFVLEMRAEVQETSTASDLLGAELRQ